MKPNIFDAQELGIALKIVDKIHEMILDVRRIKKREMAEAVDIITD